MKLEEPNITHKNEYKNMIKKWWEYEDIEEMSPWALFAWENFEEFLKINKDWKTKSPTWVNAHIFFLLNEEKILWAIQIRYDLWNEVLNEYGWHIWYWIAPEYRWNWYANEILKLWLIESIKLWINEILITCTIDNIASEKVILKNGWVFEKLANEWKYKRYIIDNKTIWK